MKIIISPSKNMRINENVYDYRNQPALIEKSKYLYQKIKQFRFDELKKILNANDKIVRYHYNNYQNFDFEHHLTPAILCFTGIQYTYMHPLTFTKEQLDYVYHHVFILSAFYGVVNALDGIKPYRLEMIHPITIDTLHNLYAFWKDDFYRELYKDDDFIVNLCSNEYRKMVEPYVGQNQKFVTVSFYEQEKQKLRQKTVYLKMARGTMINYLSSIHAKNLNDILSFSQLGYQFHKERSTDTHLVFVRNTHSKNIGK